MQHTARQSQRARGSARDMRGTALERLWPALARSPATGPEQRRVRLLTAMLAALLALASIALLVVVIVDPAGSARRGEYALLIAAVLLLLGVALALNRAGRYRLAASLTVLCAVVAPWVSALLDARVLEGDFVPLTYVVVPVLLSGILLSALVTVLVSAAQLTALVLCPLWVSTTGTVNWPSLCTMVLFVCALSVIANLMNKRDLDQIMRQNRRLAEDEALLREQSVRDHVSGLFNRRYLEETLERELRRAERDGATVAIVMLDLDRFKELNDAFGHAAGDEVLRRMGEVLKASLRYADIACRYGGDEFTLILPKAPREAVLRRAEDLRREIGALCVTFVGRPLPALTVSVGVAVFPEDGASAAALLAASDVALYQAKHAGKDRVGLAGTSAARVTPVLEPDVGVLSQ
jgi:diguanylate cyclase (GGDEF)-like protein